MSPPARLQTLAIFGTLAAWMYLGWRCELGPDAYLLVGVPLVIVHQVLIRRRRLRELWSFNGHMQWGKRSLVVSGLAATVPLGLLIRGQLHGAPIQATTAWWLATAVAGSFGFGWGLTDWLRSKARDKTLWQWMLATVIAGAVPFTLATASDGSHLRSPTSACIERFLVDALLYAEAGFLLEEVAFRGLLDQVVREAWPRHPLLSASASAFTWGLWHWPLAVHTTADLPQGARILLFHASVGTLLALIARRAGTLFPTALVHAVLDAWRNALTI